MTSNSNFVCPPVIPSSNEALGSTESRIDIKDTLVCCQMCNGLGRILKSNAATPAVGVEALRKALTEIDSIARVVGHVGFEICEELADALWTETEKARAALAQPASPLRGREIEITTIRQYVKNARGAIESGQVVDKDVRGTLTKVIAMLDALTATPAVRRPVWLRREGDHALVLVQVDGKWIEVIRERFDGAFSHIWEDNS